MQERRKNIRVEDNFQIKICTERNLFEIYSKSKNISLGGACFPVLQRFEPKMQLSLQLDLPGFKGPVPVVAEVVWLSEIEDIKYRYNLGVRFLGLLSTDQNKVFHYITTKNKSANLA